MARKLKAPGGNFKSFGQERPEAPPLAGPEPGLQTGSNRRIWLASRLQMLNLVLFTSTAIMGYLQYFLHGAPPERSLYVGIGFTVILVLYLFIVNRRRMRR